MAAMPLSPDGSLVESPPVSASRVVTYFRRAPRDFTTTPPPPLFASISFDAVSSNLSTLRRSSTMLADDGVPVRNGTAPTAKRSRTMSHSSSDREPSNGPPSPPQNDQATGTETPANSRKRSVTDTLDYPRRRATIACEICRSRKSRCDGKRPKCRLCSELNAECVYREPGIKLDAGDKLILEHLSRIENLLHSSVVTQPVRAGFIAHSPPARSPSSEVQTPQFARPEIRARRASSAGLIDMIPVNGLGTWSRETSNISTMPKRHTTPAFHLLQWPKIRDLISKPYDPQTLLQMEMAREGLDYTPSFPLDLTNVSLYVQNFFERVNVWYACVNPYNWTGFYRTALARQFRHGPESCIVLLVLALGAAGSGPSITHCPPESGPPGYNYFATAWSLLPDLMARNNMISAQCYILAAAYLFYIVRPLEAWTLLANASMKLQLLLSAPGRLPATSKELCERVYWNALLFESDLLAELDLPHSGIVQFEESVGLPGGFESDGEEPVGKDELWYFLAEIALRRLLNRVSHLLYTKTTPSSGIPPSLDAVVAELDFQLNQWYDGLPLPIQFPHGLAPLSDPVQTVLRLRFFACRTIIYRPYILAVLKDESAAMDPAVQENCRKCLEACIRQLENVQAHHAGHLPYLWQGALSMVSQTLLIMGATMSPALAALLPPTHTVDAMIYDVINEITRYAHLAPSIRLSADIIQEAEQRRRAFMASRASRPPTWDRGSRDNSRGRRTTPI